MQYILSAPLKLNLTLRITGRRHDGFHELCSLFQAFSGPETLTLTPLKGDNVKDSFVVHNERIEGPNILERATSLLRESGLDLPPMEIHLWKQIPPGSGLGAGSGNAAALLRWASRTSGISLPHPRVAELGSDVPFLYRGSRTSLVEGTGDLHNDRKAKIRLKALVFFPQWTSPTPEAYRLLDLHHQSSHWPKDRENAREEALDILKQLTRRQSVGLLPNDFVPVLLERHPAYEQFFQASRQSEALAYGITGSGSACFTLFDKGENLKELHDTCRSWNWVHKILALE